MIVVSEIGEQWSPKIAPLVTAAIVKTAYASKTPPFMPIARGNAIGIMIAVVP